MKRMSIPKIGIECYQKSIIFSRCSLATTYDEGNGAKKFGTNRKKERRTYAPEIKSWEIDQKILQNNFPVKTYLCNQSSGMVIYVTLTLSNYL